MIKDELDVWINEAKFIDSTEEYVDENGNLEGYRIYKKNGIYNRVGFCNKYPSEKWGDNGYIRGVYEPEIVKQMTREITITEYVPITDLDKG
jgi:hypothetical protein